ncbi:unnamed protein product [Brassica oleracea var. botrytis]
MLTNILYQNKKYADHLTTFLGNFCSCKDPVEPLTLDEIAADRCQAPEEKELIYKIIVLNLQATEF